MLRNGADAAQAFVPRNILSVPATGNRRAAWYEMLACGLHCSGKNQASRTGLNI